MIRLEDVKPQPWKNGVGVTRELLAWPSADDWVMRLSIADIERDGPFSAFVGIDRWFAVLAGNGVRLGAPPKAIVRGDEALHFDGALTPDCTLIDGPTRDLNLMIRRDAASGGMKGVRAGFECAAEVGVKGVFAVQCCTIRVRGEDDFVVPPMSLAWCVDVPWRVVDCDDAAPLFAFQCVERS